jgi:prophage regulatory protein
MKDDKLLKIDDVLQIIPIAKSTLWQKVKEGQLPQPVHIRKSAFWKHSDLMEFIASKAVGRSEPQGSSPAAA